MKQIKKIKMPFRSGSSKANTGEKPEKKTRTELHGALNFVLRATLYSAVLLIAYGLIPRKVWLPFEQGCAWVVWHIITSLGVTANLFGRTISSPSFSIEIIDQCLAIDLMMLLTAFIFAFPINLKRKITGFIVGIFFVFIFNIMRIVLLFFIGSSMKSWFNLAHLFIGQVTMVLTVVILFSVWVSGSFEKKRLLFLLKLTISTAVLFVIWSFVKDPYYQAGREIVSILAQPFIGPVARFKAGNSNYEFTYSFVIFVSLVLSSGFIEFKRRIAGLVIGVVILAAFQWLFVCMSAFSNIHRSFRVYQLAVALYQFSSYLLPVLLWLLMRSWRPAAKTSVNFVCPVCGELKAGMENHIRKKHGVEALQSGKVKSFFEKIKTGEPDEIFGAAAQKGKSE